MEERKENSITGLLSIIKHLQRLKNFSAEPYDLLESLEYLKEHDSLPPLWLALEVRITRRFISSEVNGKEWAWQLDESDGGMTLFSAFRYNKGAMRMTDLICPYKDSMTYQLDLAKAVLMKLFVVEKPRQDEAMMKQLEDAFLATKASLIKKAEALTF